jgi:hypothetical protein
MCSPCSSYVCCCRYAHADGQFFDPANVIFGQEGALRDAIERGGGSWGISTRAFVFHFKGATVHKRRLSLWSNELPSKEPKRVTQGDEATDNVRCRLRQVDCTAPQICLLRSVGLMVSQSSDVAVQLSECLALGTGCDGAGGEWEVAGLCGVRGGQWGQIDDSTLELRKRLMDF